MSNLSKSIGIIFLTGVIGALGTGPALADDPNPYLQPDDSWISLSGEVESVMPDQFTLDYGDGLVIVEMDDWDDDADAYKVVSGDKVTVYGLIDDDTFETTTIEASSVYVEGLNTYFYASAADEEDSFVSVAVPVVRSATITQGTVTGIDGREFTIDTAGRQFTVDTSGMPYDPLDDEGFQKIDVGDRVSVTGKVTSDFFEDRMLMAESVVELSRES
ncbi:MAG: DUF5666 domain-containing protein [Xanthomonadales bacterium]|nr:DUF5666 domain-containing protein [Xanthomonadales bacterium]